MRIIIALIIAVSMFSCSKNSEVSNENGNNNGNNNDKPEAITDLKGNKLKESSKKVETPTTNPELFQSLSNFSSEFNNDYSSDDWNAPSDVFPTTYFDKSNVKVSDGKLNITVKFKEGDIQYGKDKLHLYFQSGMLRSKSKITYGYFEARLKGCKIFNGTCPGFWLYNVPWEPVEGNDYNNKIVYSEIDIIELQQVPTDCHIMSCNYHLMYDKANSNGGFDKTFISPDKMWGNNEVLTKWDSRDDYHLYACENRPDSIIWYIDNQRIASVPNYYWHLPMYLTFTLEIRTPYEKYVNGERFIVPTTEAQATKAGFPADMKVDYVRAWKRKDYSKYKSLKRDSYQVVH